MRSMVIWVAMAMTFWGCSSLEEPTIAFYHWQTVYAPDAEVEAFSAENAEGPLYLRYFDVDCPKPNGAPNLLGAIQFEKDPPPNHIPVVFITNRTFQHIEKGAEGVVFELIQQGLINKGWSQTGEIQFDCDWSQSTRESYFQLLELFRQKYGESIKISATIRLHQIKYPDKTGIPPVDFGTLMYYNMGDLKDPDENNSILNNETGRKYLSRLPEYPLKLDLALPAFGWAVVRRMGRIINLIPEATLEEIKADTSMQLIEENQAKVIQSHYFRGEYLYADDRLRIEYVSKDDLAEAVADISRYLPPTGFRNLIFYHLSKSTLPNLQSYDLEAIRDPLY